MQRPAKPWTPVRFRPPPPFRPDGGTGRHKGLKIPRPKRRAGSIPAPGTIRLHALLLAKHFQITPFADIIRGLLWALAHFLFVERE